MHKMEIVTFVVEIYSVIMFSNNAILLITVAGLLCFDMVGIGLVWSEEREY